MKVQTTVSSKIDDTPQNTTTSNMAQNCEPENDDADSKTEEDAYLDYKNESGQQIETKKQPRSEWEVSIEEKHETMELETPQFGENNNSNLTVNEIEGFHQNDRSIELLYDNHFHQTKGGLNEYKKNSFIIPMTMTKKK
eukprot:116666_1